MTTQQQTCFTLACDGCQEQVYEFDEGSPYHFDSAEDVRNEAQRYGEWSHDGDRDLCPACTCTHIGHRKRIDGSGFVYCDRCDETLLDQITATPKAAYL